VIFLSPAIVQTELVRVAQGKRSRVPIKVLAEYVARYCLGDSESNESSRTHRDDSVRWLNRLYCLRDSRSISRKVTHDSTTTN